MPDIWGKCYQMASLGSRCCGEGFKRTACLWCLEHVSGPQPWFAHTSGERKYVRETFCVHSGHFHRPTTTAQRPMTTRALWSIHYVLTCSLWNMRFTATSSSTPHPPKKKNKNTFHCSDYHIQCSVNLWVIVFHMSRSDPLFSTPSDCRYGRY